MEDVLDLKFVQFATFLFVNSIKLLDEKVSQLLVVLQLEAYDSTKADFVKETFTFGSV